MTYTLQDLINANLPATRVYVDELGKIQADFSRTLTPEEWQTYLACVNPPTLTDYETALQGFLDQTAQARPPGGIYQDEQDCLNGLSQTDDSQWNQDAQTMLAYDEYCHETLMGVFGYPATSRLPGKQQLNPPVPPSIDEFLNSTLNSISW